MTYSSHFTLLQGEYRSIQVSVKQNSQAVDLTGATLIKWSLAKNERGASVISKSYPSNGIALSDPTIGLYEVTLLEADTTSLTPGVYYQQSSYVLNSKNIVSIVGTVRILPAIS